MKIIVVGDYSWQWYQDACSDALEKLGHDVIRHGWFDVFRRRRTSHSEPVFHSWLHKLQYATTHGPLISQINNALLEVVETENPDVILFYNVKHIKIPTIRLIKKKHPYIYFVQFSNDNPFSKSSISRIWKNYIQSIPLFDHTFAYRESNVRDYKKYNAKKISILLPYFDPNHDYPIEKYLITDEFKSDVVFAGHYEDDGRLEIIESILNNNIDLRLYGGGWDKIIKRLPRKSPLKKFTNVMPAIDKNYRSAICGTKISLCFLSSINQDSYTRRNFQIPAMKTCLLSQKTSDLLKFFNNKKEMLFFENKNELLQILRDYLQDNDSINQIAQASYDRVYKDGHDVTSRMKYFIEEISK